MGCRVTASQSEITACPHVVHISTGPAAQANGELCSPAEPTQNLPWHHPGFLEGFKPLECYDVRRLLDAQTVARSPPSPTFLLFFFPWILSEDICDEGHQQPEPCVLTGNGVWTHIESE